MSFSQAGNVGVVRILTSSYISVIVGNPNGQLLGQAGSATQPPDVVWDSTNKEFWTCTTSGSATSAVWTQGLGGSAPSPTPATPTAGHYSAIGSSQSNAPVITTQNAWVPSANPNGAIKLAANFPIPGMESTVLNVSGQTIRLFPNIGGAFNGGTTNSSITLANGAAVKLWQWAPGIFYSVGYAQINFVA